MDLSLKERDRISVLRQVSEGVLTAAAGAARTGVTRRNFRRLRRRFEAEGDAVVVHGLRGRRSNRALSPEIRERALEVARDPLYRDFGPTLLAEHLESEIRAAGGSGHAAGLDDGGRPVEAAAQAGQAPQPASAARGAGRAGAVGQPGASVAGGPGPRATRC